MTTGVLINFPEDMMQKIDAEVAKRRTEIAARRSGPMLTSEQLHKAHQLVNTEGLAAANVYLNSLKGGGLARATRTSVVRGIIDQWFSSKEDSVKQVAKPSPKKKKKARRVVKKNPSISPTLGE